jgi:D-3-phosphoglycerate dehydrogenase / 2-oxoglutarate reductase
LTGRASHAPPRVVVTDHVFADLDVERSAVAALGAELTVASWTDERSLAAAVEGADALLVCLAPINEHVIEAAARGGCRVISRYGVGVDNVDVGAATRLGIRVTNVPDASLDEVADHAMALLLQCARQIQSSVDSVRSGGWTVPHGRVHRIAGGRLALLGVGRTGRRVGTRARAFGLEVVGYDPFLREDIPGLTRVSTAEEAVADADFVSVHAPLTESTRHLVGKSLIDAMRRAPHIINTSRGALVDTTAALRALDAGTISSLALDVVEEEPLPAGSALRCHPRVFVTPHMAYYSVEAERDLQARAVEEVVRALLGDPAMSAVN